MLKNVRVIDLTELQSSIAGQMLAKLGADVVLVEPPAAPGATDTADGSWRGTVRDAFSAGKRAVGCDIRAAQGAQLLQQLCATADILIHPFTDSEAERLGLSYPALAQAHHRLIVVSVTPFGPSGPKAGYAATDLTLWAAGGALWPNRDGARAPLRTSSDQALLHAGSDAAMGALVALKARRSTGRGQLVSVAAVESVAQATLSTVLAASVGHENFIPGGAPPEPKPGTKKQLDLSGSGSRTRRSKWAVKDGTVELHLAMGPAAGRFTNNLFAWLRSIDACDRKFAEWDWAKEVPARILDESIADQDLEDARDQVAAALARFTKEELLQVSMRFKLILAPLMSIADLANSAHFSARGAFVDSVDLRGRRFHLPAAVTGTSHRDALRPPPGRGQHNQDIYRAIGLDQGRIEQLTQQGVI